MLQACIASFPSATGRFCFGVKYVGDESYIDIGVSCCCSGIASTAEEAELEAFIAIMEDLWTLNPAPAVIVKSSSKSCLNFLILIRDKMLPYQQRSKPGNDAYEMRLRYAEAMIERTSFYTQITFDLLPSTITRDALRLATHALTHNFGDISYWQTVWAERECSVRADILQGLIGRGFSASTSDETMRGTKLLAECQDRLRQPPYSPMPIEVESLSPSLKVSISLPEIPALLRRTMESTSSYDTNTTMLQTVPAASTIVTGPSPSSSRSMPRRVVQSQRHHPYQSPSKSRPAKFTSDPSYSAIRKTHTKYQNSVWFDNPNNRAKMTPFFDKYKAIVRELEGAHPQIMDGPKVSWPAVTVDVQKAIGEAIFDIDTVAGKTKPSRVRQKYILPGLTAVTARLVSGLSVDVDAQAPAVLAVCVVWDKAPELHRGFLDFIPRLASMSCGGNVKVVRLSKGIKVLFPDDVLSAWKVHEDAVFAILDTPTVPGRLRSALAMVQSVTK
ncbi:hypothetical protein CYLTODRAFT_455220 [Cylindrobasidium torrendii FP15055 ss-10]|uniref:Uncharacterized protein n=1 Tax=Cylindrobasidium torrendii FP15055 ss-10 TaxID=1314674 RepID=A0A0D7B7Y3_9AGAR|nr:hypothetical protein CYLTODRAFT_455220 [Cylindrobasidium torrendii FP15055 ss-10]